MSTNALSRRLVDEIVKYLANGGTMILDIAKPNLSVYWSAQAKRYISKTATAAVSRRLIRYMRQQNLVSVTNLPKGKMRLRLAANGQKRAQKITLSEMTLPRPRRWDRHWRVVFFDIPEEKRQARNKLVAKLKDLGFYQLQKSTWIHPYPCLIEIEFIKHAYKVTPYVTLAEIDKIDRHQQLVRHFRSTLV